MPKIRISPQILSGIIQGGQQLAANTASERARKSNQEFMLDQQALADERYWDRLEDERTYEAGIQEGQLRAENMALADYYGSPGVSPATQLEPGFEQPGLGAAPAAPTAPDLRFELGGGPGTAGRPAQPAPGFEAPGMELGPFPHPGTVDPAMERGMAFNQLEQPREGQYGLGELPAGYEGMSELERNAWHQARDPERDYAIQREVTGEAGREAADRAAFATVQSNQNALLNMGDEEILAWLTEQGQNPPVGVDPYDYSRALGNYAPVGPLERMSTEDRAFQETMQGAQRHGAIAGSIIDMYRIGQTDAAVIATQMGLDPEFVSQTIENYKNRPRQASGSGAEADPSYMTPYEFTEDFVGPMPPEYWSRMEFLEDMIGSFKDAKWTNEQIAREMRQAIRDDEMSQGEYDLLYAKFGLATASETTDEGEWDS